MTERAYARTKDPATSWLAAESVKNMSATRLRIYTILISEGPCSDEAIYEWYRFHYGAISRSGCRTRRKELSREGFVIDAGYTTLTALGRKTIVWKAVPPWEANPQQGRFL